MNSERHQKVKASHLARDAYLYVRQATRCQRFENAQAIEQQYSLRQQAVALGWPSERVLVIENDVGQSAAWQAPRLGFEILVRQIELGCVGIAMALDPSRLARNDSDWQRLVEACALSKTLLLDQSGLYDPGDSDDRLLLGCAKTMPSTAESCHLGKEARI
jgi:DNA invertase Pin-like site-specific DNA recombinase